MIEQVYSLFYKELLRYAISLCKEMAEGEDLVQESFLRALEREEYFLGMDSRQQKSWLYKTVKNLWIDRYRKKRSMPEAEESTIFFQDLSQVFVAQLCEILKPEDRALFFLRYFEGYNASELGEWFGQPSSTIRGRLLACRNRLKRYYPELIAIREDEGNEKMECESSGL